MKVKVPDDTRSLHKIGEYVMSYDGWKNAYANALANRIGRVLITSKVWNDPWAALEKGKLELGETVEEVFVNIANPQKFDPELSETNVFKRVLPDIRAAFHTMNYQKYYKVSVSDAQLRQAFLSWGDVNSLTSYIVDSLYTGMALDAFLVKKYMLARELVNGGFHEVITKPIEGDGANPKDAVAKYREYTNNMLLLKSIYNRAGVRTSTPIADQLIIIPNHVEAVLGVEVLASAFQLSQVDYISKRIPVDSFEFDADDEARLALLFKDDPDYNEFTGPEKASLQKVNAVKIDRNWMMVFDNLQEMESIRNGEGLYWQYWLHSWKTVSASPYSNAIAFTEEASEITEVSVSPATANVAQGSDLTLTATVSGTGLYEKSVTWSIDGQTSDDTRINADSGVLHVSASEEASTEITVTATAKDGQTGTATITVVAA